MVTPIGQHICSGGLKLPNYSTVYAFVYMYMYMHMYNYVYVYVYVYVYIYKHVCVFMYDISILNPTDASCFQPI
jgi:hypothetical protein